MRKQTDKATPWKITVFGELTVTRKGKPYGPFAPKQASLLGHLAVRSALYGTSWRREELAEALWPEGSDRETKSRRLRTHLSYLRARLQPYADELLQANAQTIELDPDITNSDLHIFQKCLSAAKKSSTALDKVLLLLRAIRVSQHELLPSCWDEYFEIQRIHLAKRHREAYRDLAFLYAEAGMYRDVIACAAPLIDQESVDEELYQRFAFAYAVLGKREEARALLSSLEERWDDTCGGILMSLTQKMAYCLEKGHELPDPPWVQEHGLLPSVFDDETEPEWEAEDRPDTSFEAAGCSTTAPAEEPEHGVVQQAQSVALVGAVKARSDVTRGIMKPFLLSHIPRPELLGQILAHLRRKQEAMSSTAVLLTGHAGYGKTVLLGDLYDALTKDGHCCVGLVRCDDLAPGASEEEFDRSVGHVLTGGDYTGTEVIEKIGAVKPVILLFDTLDLLLGARFVPMLGKLLYRWMRGIPLLLLFTCRTHDYTDYLLPLPQRWPGIAADTQEILGFTSEEVGRAVEVFFSRHPVPGQEANGEAFAQAVLTLSANNRSLAAITHCPLLLALLCELYGSFGAPPADLTISGLYTKYWEAKVRSERSPDSDAQVRQRTAEERVRLCLDLAEHLFHISSQRLYETADVRCLEVHRDASRMAAYQNLCSEYVVETDLRQRVRFFHQTFEEFAIACWLDSSPGYQEKERLLEQLLGAEAAASQHWWPTVRQYLSLAEPDELQRWAEALHPISPLAFRTVALATVARDATLFYLPTLEAFALSQRDAFAEALLLALDSAPGYFSPPVWQTLCILLSRCSRSVAKKAAMQVGERLRFAVRADRRLDEALAAIRARTVTDTRLESADDRAEVSAKLLEYFLGKQERFLTEETQTVLHRHYDLFGEQMREQIVRLCLAADFTKACRHSLLRSMVACPLPRTLREEATNLFCEFLSDFTPVEEARIWQWWQSTFVHPFPERWHLVIAKVMGRCAATFPALVEQMMRQIQEGTGTAISQNTIALQEAARHGAQEQVLAALEQADIPEGSSSRRKAVAHIRRFLIAGQQEGVRLSKRKQELSQKTTAELLAMARSSDQDAASLLKERTKGEDAADVSDFLSLLNVKKAGVCVAGLQGLMELMEQSCEFTEAYLDALVIAFRAATDAAAVGHFCQCAGRWMRQTNRIHTGLTEEVMAVPARLKQAGTYDGGIARYVLETLATVVTVGDTETRRRVGEYLRVYWDTCDFSRVGNWKRVVKILRRVMVVKPDCLVLLVADVHRRALEGTLWKENVDALVEAIWAIEGRHSELLSGLLKSDWCPDSSKAMIANKIGLR